MCTAISFLTNDHYFGRNLDLEYHYTESVTVTPRNFPFIFRRQKPIKTHFAMIGMATVADGYPLYYEATNEKGLSLAGLNFPGNAVYHAPTGTGIDLAPYELIPWVLGQCGTAEDALALLQNINIVNIPFSEEFGLSDLHWLLSDKNESITIEPFADGLHIIKNPIGVLTNNPPFEYHMYHLTEFLNLTADAPENRFSSGCELQPYSRGMGAIGLPGDLSSGSRFVRAAFTKLNSVCQPDEDASVSQFFHILDSVAQQQGCVKVGDSLEKTVYSSCCNTDKGIYYYTTYENRQISAVDLHGQDLQQEELFIFPLITKQQIYKHNQV